MISIDKFKDQKVSIVTGANGGIGLSIVKKFLESGYFVIGCFNNKSDQLEAFINKGDYPIIIKKIDICNYKDTSDFINEIYASFKELIF